MFYRLFFQAAMQRAADKFHSKKPRKWGAMKILDASATSWPS